MSTRSTVQHDHHITNANANGTITIINNKINIIKTILLMQTITTTTTTMKLWMRTVLVFILQLIITETRTIISMKSYHN